MKDYFCCFFILNETLLHIPFCHLLCGFAIFLLLWFWMQNWVVLTKSCLENRLEREALPTSLVKLTNSTRRFWRFDVSSYPQKQAKIATFSPQIGCFDSLLRSMCFACHTSSASYDFNIYSRCPYPRYRASNFVRFSARLRNSICKQNWRFILQVVINDGLLLCLLSHFF